VNFEAMMKLQELLKSRP